MEKQVISIFAGTQGFCDGLPVSSLQAFEAELHKHFEEKHQDLLDRIVKTKQIDDETKEKLGDVIKAFAADFGKSQAAE